MGTDNFTVGFYTLGCKVNQYESEAMAEALSRRGLSVLPPTEPCDVYVINTCTVTGESDRKARQFIRRAIAENPAAYILVTGCLAQINAGSIASIPGVDFICGNTNKMAVVEKALSLLSAGHKNPVPEIELSVMEKAPFEPMSISRFDRTRAYIKIEDGCDKKCAYCIIPKARGVIRSKPTKTVLDEVRTLVQNGCREVVLTGIETASWGKDLNEGDLGDLLRSVNAVEGLSRIRLGSLDPSLMKPSFVDKIAPLEHLSPHFHLSLQSGSSRVLAGMRRRYNREMAMEAIERVRKAIPEAMFTTDIIVGFPGETEEDFAETVSFVKEARFLMVHVFPYSIRPGTEAAGRKDQIPEPVKRRRVSELMTVSRTVRSALLDEYVATHSETTVLFESFEKGRVYGHTSSFVEVEALSDKPLHSLLYRVRLTGHNEDMCRGELLSSLQFPS